MQLFLFRIPGVYYPKLPPPSRPSRTPNVPKITQTIPENSVSPFSKFLFSESDVKSVRAEFVQAAD